LADKGRLRPPFSFDSDWHSGPDVTKGQQLTVLLKIALDALH
jgi:hypothetical protein